MVFTCKPSKLLVLPLFSWGVVVGMGGLIISSCVTVLKYPLTVSTIFWGLVVGGVEIYLGLMVLLPALEQTRWFWFEGGVCKWRSLRMRGELTLPLRVLCQRHHPTGRDRSLYYPVSLIQSDDRAGMNKVLIEAQWLSWTARRLAKKVSEHLQIDAEDRIIFPGRKPPSDQ